VPLAAAIIAVLAALGTLFAQHRSISALSVKNDSILSQTRALDLYNYYQARRTRFTVYSALIAAGMPSDAAARKRLEGAAALENRASAQTLAEAKRFESTSEHEQDRSESILQSFETLEVATTLFEIAIVFVSISALSQTRLLLYLAGGMGAAGLAFLIFGLLQAH
ncbi:MAG: DUF4337 family protein, partial [Vulcanimicrobiaceae bacterium]